MPENVELIISLFFLAITLIPFSNLQHWSARVFDYVRLQLTGLFIVYAAILFFFDDNTSLIALTIVACSICLQFWVIAPYLIPKRRPKKLAKLKELHIISCNVYQYNRNYSEFNNLILGENPDFFCTLESDEKWEIAIDKSLSKTYPYSQKVAKDNTYGMHFYSKHEFNSIKTHYFLSTERPAIEVEFKLDNIDTFQIWILHPPPPSPTEESTANKKNSELLLAAKAIKKSKDSVLVIGDFNNVCWSRVTKLFAKTAILNDARKGRGLYSSFPAKYPPLSFPLDLVYHSENLNITKLDTLENIGSDHLPISCHFQIKPACSLNNKELEYHEQEEVEELIQKGIEEELEEVEK